MTKLIIFGTGAIAQLAHYYFTIDSKVEVAGFTVDREFKKEDTLAGLPIVEFETVESIFPPSHFRMFIALSYSRSNKIRQRKYEKAKEAGYNMGSYVSSRAILFPNVSLGDNCFILENNVVQPFASIGNNVTLWSGNHIGHHTRISDHCFVSSHVVIGGGAILGECCFVGINATIRDHITIGRDCVIGARALVVQSAEAGGLYAEKGTSRSNIPAERLRHI